MLGNLQFVLFYWHTNAENNKHMRLIYICRGGGGGLRLLHGTVYDIFTPPLTLSCLSLSLRSSQPNAQSPAGGRLRVFERGLQDGAAAGPERQGGALELRGADRAGRAPQGRAPDQRRRGPREGQGQRSGRPPPGSAHRSPVRWGSVASPRLPVTPSPSRPHARRLLTHPRPPSRPHACTLPRSRPRSPSAVRYRL